MADRFRLLKFTRSKSMFNKYDAILQDKITLKTGRVPFGNSRMGHYRDDTGLKIYSKMDNRNEKQRTEYLKRHEDTRLKIWSPSWFCAVYLYNSGSRS